MDAVEVEFPASDLALKEPLRVDAFLARRLHRYSRAAVQRLIAEKRVFLRGRPRGGPAGPRGTGREENGLVRPAKAASRVGPEETVVVRYPRRPEPPCRHASLAVLHRDPWLLAVDKPGGVLSHPTDKVLENAATTILARQFPGERLHLAHRLDRETSGVLLLARAVEAARSLAGRFEGRRVEKEYLALVRGEASFKSRSVSLALGREGGEIKVRQAAREEGQPAVTEFELLGAGGGVSLVRAVPRTGRLHQIRVHLASLGLPVLGDKLYSGGGEHYMKAVRKELTAEDLEALGAERQMLHARCLRLDHPMTGEPLEIAAPLPEDFLAVMRRAGIPCPGLAPGQSG